MPANAPSPCCGWASSRSSADVQPTVDLNCDLGEGAGHDAELMPLISSANIACGAHAGDLATMSESVALARHHGVGIGAHPGYFDLAGFGRGERSVEPAEAARLVAVQIETLQAIAGADLRHVKLHGALYNQVSRESLLAAAIVTELKRRWPELVLFALAGSVLARLARERGLTVAEEFFADRTYLSDGRLTPRSQANALVEDEATAVAQVIRAVREGAVRAVDGRDIPVRAETICLHGDGPQAVAFAQRLRAEFSRAGIAVAPFRR